MAVVLLFNKLDLLNKKLRLDQVCLQRIYEKIGYKCFALSVTIDDLSALKLLMKDKINMISGHSGVGKSTFINRLQPDLHINTSKVSDFHKQGQHTTTFSQLYDLDFGASIIDTPGIKGFGLVDLSALNISSCFKEFLTFSHDCKFHNCIHHKEPDCAVKFALSNGGVSESRYKNYLNMLVEQSNYRKNDY